MIEVQNTIKIYEINGQEVKDPVTMKILGHGFNQRMVVLWPPGDPKNYSVSAADLESAIQNAINTNPVG